MPINKILVENNFFLNEIIEKVKRLSAIKCPHFQRNSRLPFDASHNRKKVLKKFLI